MSHRKKKSHLIDLLVYIAMTSPKDIYTGIPLSNFAVSQCYLISTQKACLLPVIYIIWFKVTKKRRENNIVRNAGMFLFSVEKWQLWTGLNCSFLMLIYRAYFANQYINDVRSKDSHPKRARSNRKKKYFGFAFFNILLCWLSYYLSAFKISYILHIKENPYCKAAYLVLV
jgi:hypothetical protein